MALIGYYLFLFFCTPLTYLPSGVLYFFARPIFFILYRVLHYRKKVVADNLKASFPDKSIIELKHIEKDFYKHLSEVFVEYLVLIRIKTSELSKRYVFTNTELIDKLYNENKDIVLVTGHYGNWEWMAQFPLFTNFNFCAVYKQQKNKYFDKFITKLRARFGTQLVKMEGAYRYAYSNKKKNVRSILYLIADQLPPRSDMKYFTNFLNHEGTAVYIGPERIAKSLDMAVVFLNVDKISRGKYKISFSLLAKDSKQTQEGEITEAFIRHLENRIKENPQYWLWSHRRWKRTQKDLVEKTDMQTEVAEESSEQDFIREVQYI